MSLFNFSEPELLCFFAVLVRYGTLIAVLPITGDRFVPAPAKVLLALAISMAMFPALMSSGQVRAVDAVRWGSTAGSLLGTVALEALFGLTLGFVARMAFDTISFGANLAGTFMGFAMATHFDPHQESQSQVVAEIQMALATLAFLAMDGHHLMLRASLDSYRIVGVGAAGMNAAVASKLTELTGHVIAFGIQLAAPVAVALFAVNVVFGVMAKAMPNMNVLVISFAVTALVGLMVMLIGIPEFQGAASEVMGRVGEWMESVARAMAQSK